MMIGLIKHRISMACTGLLYIGAMLAGLAGFGWGLILAFTVIFFIGLAAQSPDIWPERAADWLRGETLSRNGLRILIQLLLVTFCFSVGRGIGGVAGTVVPLPLGVPLGLALLALPIARLLRGDAGSPGAPAPDTGAKEA